MNNGCKHEGVLYSYSPSEIQSLQAQLPRANRAPVRAIEECRRCGVVQIARRSRPGYQSVERYRSLADARSLRPFEVNEVRLPRYGDTLDESAVGISV